MLRNTNSPPLKIPNPRMSLPPRYIPTKHTLYSEIEKIYGNLTLRGIGSNQGSLQNFVRKPEPSFLITQS